MKKITKRQAKRLFNEGNLIYLCASKCTPQSVNGNKPVSAKSGSFENHILDFKDYYCTKVLGKSVHFYKSNLC